MPVLYKCALLYCPVPLKGNCCGLPGLLSYRLKFAFSAAFLLGLKNTLKVQVAAGASTPPQGGLPEPEEKSALFGPVIVSEVNTRVVVPTLVIVTGADT